MIRHVLVVMVVMWALALSIYAEFDSKERQLHALRLLCCLLPAANRDTLRALLEFLYLVSMHAGDQATDGREVRHV